MKRMIFQGVLGWLASVFALAGALAADGNATIVQGPNSTASEAGTPQETPQPKFRTTAEKRDWLQAQIARGLSNPWQVRQLQANVNRLSAKQVDSLTDAILAQQLPNDWQQAPQLERAQLDMYRSQVLRQVLADQGAWRRFDRVGYLPVITWLPQGTAFGAGATISPDGRYVRTNANPFFSSVGPVYTYNYRTGETQLMPPQSSYPSYWNRPLGSPDPNAAYRMGQMPPQHLPPRAPSAYPEKWYDGFRMRYGPRP
jgi:hypothetical protein